MNRRDFLQLLAVLPANAGLDNGRTDPAHGGSADLVIVNAGVRTMRPDNRIAEAVAVKGNRIVAVGSNAEIRSLADARTKTIDAGGRLVLPGFNDSHVHFLEGGGQLAGVQLRDARTPAEFADRIRQFVAKTPPGRWILHGSWDHENWPGTPLPTRDLIDAFTPENPVLVSRLDGHMALANSLALKLAGVTRETQDPPGGLIVRDSKTGEPTGVLKDAALGLVGKVVPPPSFEENLAALKAASDLAASVGVTSVQDMTPGPLEMRMLQTLQAQGGLKTRHYTALGLSEWTQLADLNLPAAFGSERLRIGILKAFADGSLGSRTAWLFAPYRDDPATSGLARAEMTNGAMLERIRSADRAGLQVAVHAIGDRANAEMLAIYAQVTADNPKRDRRFRIEHAQHLRPEDIPRFARAQVIASMQPIHEVDDGRWAEKRIGMPRCRSSYCWRSLLDSGAKLAFGTDWPVAPLDPLQGLWAAVTRRTADGKHPEGWIPEQKITIEEAVRAYTLGSAYAEFQEQEKGTIEPGKLADLVILSKDIFRIQPKEIADTHVLLTVMDGRVVFDRLGGPQTSAKENPER